MPISKIHPLRRRRPRRHRRGEATQQARLVKVLERLTEYLRLCDDEEAELWTDSLDDFLDGIAAEDGFGTEGQTDPRGDGRNGEWSMRRVEGIDE